MMRSALIASALIVAAGIAPAARDRRVVDTVLAGDVASEMLHGYAGHNDSAQIVDGRPARRTTGWIRYALTTFDDTDVTIACTFAGAESGEYDLVVEDSLIASKRYDASGSLPSVVNIDVPFAVTKGKATVVVMLRARHGATPPLVELRTIQDHNEVLHSSGVVR